MFFLGLLVVCTLGAATLPLTVAGPTVLADQVFVNGDGPFRFLVDTGAQSSTISPRAAKRLALRPRYAVIRVTPTSEEKVPAHVASQVSVGPAVAQDVELLESSIAGDRLTAHRIDGILGMNFLGRFAWLLDQRAATITFDFDGSLGRRLDGQRLVASLQDDRLVISARASGRPVPLVLDSGASHLVLFDSASLTGIRPASLESNSGIRPAYVGRLARLEVGGRVLRNVQAGLIEAPARVERGLLPLSLFEWVYADPRASLVIVK